MTASVKSPAIPQQSPFTFNAPKKPRPFRPSLDFEIVGRALSETLTKLNPHSLWKNPSLLVVELLAVLVSGLVVRDLLAGRTTRSIDMQAAFWLWVIVLIANFVEAMAEARGKSEANALRKAGTDVLAKRVGKGGKLETVAASQLRSGDVVIAEAGDMIPGDGDVIEGIAMIDESVITGESAPVIRESGADRSAVTSGTRVLSDKISVRIASSPGETFLDRTIAATEIAQQQKTPAEIKLNNLISLWTLILLVASGALYFLISRSAPPDPDAVSPIIAIIALLVCLLPTTLAGLLSSVGIGGITRAMQHKVLATSRVAVEAAGEIDMLLLDKTGTVTFGDRKAIEFVPAPGVKETDLAEAARLASLGDDTPEGRSIVSLAEERYGLVSRAPSRQEAVVIPFSAYTRMSGVDWESRRLRKGACAAVGAFVRDAGGAMPSGFKEAADRISRTGGTPLAVAAGCLPLGLIHLKDIVKDGLKERLDRLRTMGVDPVMITGDNPITTAAIAAEAGVHDYVANATPGDKLAYIKKKQAAGHLVAMTGDGANDAPALAQADVGVAMNTGEMAAKEAANIIILDSNPTKLIEIIAIGKQLLLTRRALTILSTATSISTFFLIVPALFMKTCPSLGRFNILGLHTPGSALLGAIIFQALALAAFAPLALQGVRYEPIAYLTLIRRNNLTSVIAGLVAPLPSIWILDRLLAAFKLA